MFSRAHVSEVARLKIDFRTCFAHGCIRFPEPLTLVCGRYGRVPKDVQEK